MFRPTVRVNSRNRLKELAKAIERIAGQEVLVGIPQEKSSRPESGEKVNNAELLYIHTHGSPVRNIPARPVLQPAIEDSKERIAERLKAANVAALSGNAALCESELHKAGFVAENAAKAWFENPKNNWTPNSPKTILSKGSDLPLIDTGEMRKSITHVLRAK